jgi:hypothetical protein
MNKHKLHDLIPYVCAFLTTSERSIKEIINKNTDENIYHKISTTRTDNIYLLPEPRRALTHNISYVPGINSVHSTHEIINDVVNIVIDSNKFKNLSQIVYFITPKSNSSIIVKHGIMSSKLTIHSQTVIEYDNEESYIFDKQSFDIKVPTDEIHTMTFVNPSKFMDGFCDRTCPDMNRIHDMSFECTVNKKTLGCCILHLIVFDIRLSLYSNGELAQVEQSRPIIDS